MAESMRKSLCLERSKRTMHKREVDYSFNSLMLIKLSGRLMVNVVMGG